MRALLLLNFVFSWAFASALWAADIPAPAPTPSPTPNTYENQQIFSENATNTAGFWDSLNRGDLSRPPAEPVSTMESKRLDVSSAKSYQTPDLSASLFKLFLYLAAIIFLLIFFLYLLKRFLPKSVPLFSGGMIRVVARHFLDQKKVIYIINISDRQFLIVGTTPEHINTLAEVTDPELIKDILAQAPINAPVAGKDSGKFLGLLREKLFGAKSGASSSAEKRG